MFIRTLLDGKNHLVGVAFSCALFLSGSAYAQCCGCMGTAASTSSALVTHVGNQHNTTRNHIQTEHDTTRTHIDTEHTDTRTWIQDVWWDTMLAPALQDMANEISTVGMASTMAVGSFFDAQNHIQAQRSLSELKARAHKDYMPSSSLCVFGTGIKSLASSQHNSMTTKNSLVKWSLDRQLGNSSVAGSEGSAQDKTIRVMKFKEIYCDPLDNAGAFSKFCEIDGTNTVVNERVNADIDYTRVFDSPLTLDLDFENHAISNDEEDIMALAKNLYAHDIYYRPSIGSLAIGSNQDDYMNARAVIAKRNVAENSFFSIAAMKSRGSVSDPQYIQNAIRQMGVGTTDANELTEYLGENPSYHAQMEILTKKLYQNPNFYINLIDNPANVDRQHAAMQSFELMQQRDIFESFLRTEMLLSMLVELELDELQEEVQNDLSAMPSYGERE